MSFRGMRVFAMATLVIAAQAQTISMRTWKDPSLQLTFSYPAELQPRDGGPAGSGCAKVLLAAGLGTDPNQPGAAETAQSSARWATLTLSDMGPDCIPPRALKKSKMMDQMMVGLTGSATQTLGLMPLEQPVGYLLQGRHACIAAAQGEPVSSNGLQPANGAEVLAVIAVHVGDRVLIWRLASNDANLLNRILASQVNFGDTASQPLYPGHVGE